MLPVRPLIPLSAPVSAFRNRSRLAVPESLCPLVDASGHWPGQGVDLNRVTRGGGFSPDGFPIGGAEMITNEEVERNIKEGAAIQGISLSSGFRERFEDLDATGILFGGATSADIIVIKEPVRSRPKRVRVDTSVSVWRSLKGNRPGLPEIGLAETVAAFADAIHAKNPLLAEKLRAVAMKDLDAEVHGIYDPKGELPPMGGQAEGPKMSVNDQPI